MLDIIANNPFRVLGVWSNAKQAEIVRNLGRMKAFLNVGKSVEFPSDLNNVLPPISRTMQTAQESQSALNLPADKIRHALFWFSNCTPIDQAALNNLSSGDSTKAMEILSKRDTFSSLTNKAVLSLIMANYPLAVSSYSSLIHDYTFRTQFCTAVCGDTFQIAEEELSHIVLDELVKVVGGLKLLDILSVESDKTYVKGEAVKEPLARINSEILKAKNVSSGDSSASLRAGRSLIRNTRSSLVSLRSIVGSSDIQYQSAADNLAKQILQCGINYYNNSDDDDCIEKGLELQEYALRIAVGKLTKERCQKNVDILKKKKEQEAFSKDIESIVIELKSLNSAIPSISRATSFVNNCKPHLSVIKENLGSYSDEYLKISSAVANNALGMIISVVNSAQSSSNLATNIVNGYLESTIDSAISAMSVIGTLDMTSSERSHFDQNKSTLSSLKTQLSALKSSSSYSLSPNRSSSTYRSSSSSSSDDTNWGCIIWVILGVIGIIIAAVSG